MSFLAGLRQQQSAAEQQLKLCYLLEHGGACRGVRISLVVAEFERGHPTLPGTPYMIRPEHLYSPPPYLNARDLLILQQLLDDNAAWLEQTAGFLPSSSSHQLMQQLLAADQCYLQLGSDHWRKLTLHSPDSERLTEPVRPGWVFDAWGSQTLQWQRPGGSTLIFHHCLYLLWEDTGVVAVAQCHLSSEAIALAMAENLSLDYRQVSVFLENHATGWRALGLPLPVEPVVIEDEMQVTPVIQLTSLPMASSAVPSDQLELVFRYAGSGFCAVFQASENRQEVSYEDRGQVHFFHRNSILEREWHARLRSYLGAFRQCEQTDCWTAQRTEHWRQLLLESRSELQAEGFHFCVNKGFQHHYVQPQKWQVELQASANGKWKFAVSLNTGAADVDLMQVLGRLQNHTLSDDAYPVELPDGCKLLLPVERLNGLREELGDLVGPSSGSGLPASQLSRLAELKTLLPDETEWAGDLELLNHAQAIRCAPTPIPDVQMFLGTELRDYQQTGVCWLQHLRQQGVNGLLADDMGLGKTLQSIAHLCLEQHLGLLALPALIVAPTSLLHNWAAEIRRFAPGLSCLIQHGKKRHHNWNALKQYDLVITSYSLVVRDMAYWQQQPLSWLVLDEAQTIKNPRTSISRAVRQLNCAHRLCLTGTPVENHLGELWSIFDFLMPGCLGSAEQFKRYYRRPIEQEANEPRLKQLLRRIAPFMLRRTKDQVARDLPPKTEIVRRIAMAEDQRDFYQQLRTSGWEKLEGELASGTEGQQHIQVLAALMKLRQACCDPGLLGEPSISSAKREQCLQMVEELVAEGRAVLVFSQFTSMLDLLASALSVRGIDYLMLTGSSRERGALVNAFQRGEAPVFLISLKAGGVGLNLTRADTVIHYDPWWNSAVEQQAADRAHRIGQDKPVFVYKLIMEDSVEEKIAEIQLQKAALGWHIGEQAKRSGEHFALGLQELLALMEDKGETSDAAAVNS